MEEIKEFGKRVTIEEARSIIKGRIEKGYKRPVFLWGGAGVGKTTLVRDLAKELSATLIEKRLSNENPVTVVGLFYPDDKTKMSYRFLRSEWESVFQEDILTIIFFDELLNAPQDVISSIWEILNEGTVDGKPLKNTYIILASNPIVPRIQAYFNPAFWSRFSHFTIVPSVDEVAAYLSKICRHVPTFLKLNPHFLYLEGGEFGIRANPRIWEHVAIKCCKLKDDYFEDELDPDLKEIPKLFMKMKNELNKLPSIEEYIKNPKKIPKIDMSDSEKISLGLYIIFSLPYYDVDLVSFAEAVQSKFPDEFIYLTIKVLKKKYPVDKVAKAFSQFIDRKMGIN